MQCRSRSAQSIVSFYLTAMSPHCAMEGRMYTRNRKPESMPGIQPRLKQIPVADVEHLGCLHADSHSREMTVDARCFWYLHALCPGPRVVIRHLSRADLPSLARAPPNGQVFAGHPKHLSAELRLTASSDLNSLLLMGP
ncbi:hypothetical protein LshimejAT787_1105240 [Lyophyllum shimeji]|uniref:Uncharacterized protein n=1 Tax=Lyophyllum shimeji TaxID=47721 RepID=A0A9P3PVZ2_LYOSH|nr:hypothetical protein LshimejAT787_1105240 [Lyophyllum shimeji]